MKTPKSPLRDDWTWQEKLWGPVGKPENRAEWFLWVMAIIGLFTSFYLMNQAWSWVVDHWLYG